MERAGTTTSRLERVREILNEAAGDSTADYGGVGPFWELPYPELLTVVVCGVRMIAPEREAPHACCGGAASGESEEAEGGEGAEAGDDPGGRCRAARSGLIQGLLGQRPFDGSQFPRLPWGGEAVSADGIQYIADWIDDGCPADERELAEYAVERLDAPIALVEIEPEAHPSVEVAERTEFGVYEGTPGEYQYRRGEIRQRMNIDCLTEAQLERLRFAFREMYRLNHWPNDSRSYNNQALVHQDHCQHGWERFLPWHRIYLYEFEQALQDLCPGVTVPYWDWTEDRYRPDHPQDGARIPRALKLFLTGESLEFLKRHEIPTEPLRDLAGEGGDGRPPKHFASLHCFFAVVKQRIDEKYTEGEYRKRFIDALLETNALWYPLRYPGEYLKDGKSTTINVAFNYHYPSKDDIRQILCLRTFRDFGGGSLYNDAFGFLDQNPHNTMHIWTGGQNPDYKAPGPGMAVEDRNAAVEVAGRDFHSREDLYSQPMYGDMLSNLTASYDPIFWPVHANVDRLWHEWQQSNPHGNPADLDSVLTPWSYTIRDTLEMDRFGYEYVKCAYIVPVGSEAPVGRFVSKPIEVPEAVRDSFVGAESGRAEVRLHRMPQLPRSCFVRVFLNFPEASANTSLDHPHYAGYLAVFGHGACYGGPGHCDTPPLTRRRYDLRPRSHNTPRNHRVDVTECARRLLKDDGATSLTITLVVIGADYREDQELLRLEGVSLNFLD